MENVDWNAVKKTFLQTFAGFVLLGAGASFYFFELRGALLTLGAAVYLVSGFWITENLVGLMTRVKRVSPTTAIFLMVGKFLWWGGLFVAMKKLGGGGSELPIAIGIGAFLLALLAAVLSHAFVPKVSDAAGE